MGLLAFPEYGARSPFGVRLYWQRIGITKTRLEETEFGSLKLS